MSDFFDDLGVENPDTDNPWAIQGSTSTDTSKSYVDMCFGCERFQNQRVMSEGGLVTYAWRVRDTFFDSKNEKIWTVVNPSAYRIPSAEDDVCWLPTYEQLRAFFPRSIPSVPWDRNDFKISAIEKRRGMDTPEKALLLRIVEADGKYRWDKRRQVWDFTDEWLERDDDED